MKMKKTFELTVIAASLFAALFVGCSNMGAADAGAGLQNAAECGTEGTVTISGALDIGGAAPAEILAAVQNGGAASGASRSAFPQIPATGLEYSVKAVNTADASIEYNGTVTVADDGALSYTVPIPAIYPSTSPTKQYKTVASVKSNGVEILKGESKNTEYYTLSPSAPFVTNKNVTLSAAQTGSGLFALQVDDPDSKIGSACVSYEIDGTAYEKNATKEGTTWTFSMGAMTAGVLTNGVSAGAHLMAFEFYSGATTDGTPIYSFTEAVNIFANLATNKWVQNGNEPWFNTTTDAETGVKTTICQITSAMVDGFKLTDIYVDPYAATTTESGTFLNPKRSFTDALAMLQDASKGYTIFIKGTIGPLTIPDTLKNSGSGGGNTYAKSLTLCGADDPDPSGVPTDIIDASGAAGVSALTIATTVPVTIKNLKITGGRGTIKEVSTMGGMFTNSNACGGGIYLSAAGGSLTLGKGAYVSENSADASAGASSLKYGYGGGVFISAPGELNLLDGSVVSNNGAESNGYGGGIAIYDIDATGASCKLNIYDGALIEENQATFNGGGIFLGKLPVDVAMSGGRISGNVSGVSGGAICGSSGTFTMTGGVIGDDSDSITLAAKYGDSTRTSAKSNKTGGNGGAFCFANTSGGSDEFNINLYGGTVAYNCAQDFGGAFSLQGGNLTVKGAEIKWNGASGESSADGGGAVFLTSCAKLYLDGCTITGNECYGSSEGGAICMIGNSDTTRTPKTFLKGAVSIPSDGPQNNDICLECYGNTTEWLKDPLLYIEGKLTGSEPVARITIAPDDEAYYTAYRSNRQVLKLADGVTNVNFPLECYKFAVTPQASATPAQEWAVAGDGYLAKITTLTGTNIDGFTVADFNEGDKVVYAFDSSVTNDQIDAFTRKLYNKTENQNLSGKKVGEGSVLDFSKATNLTSLGFSWSNNGVFQPFDIILPPNFDTSKFSNQTFAWAIKNAKNVIATPKASGGLVSEDGVVYNKNKTTIFFYPGGKTATSFAVPDGVTTIPRNSFSYNSSLKNITLPEGVTSIAWNACCATSIESINVPSTVKTIANEAFSNSASFTSLTFADPTGWKLGPVEAEATAVNSSNLSNPATAATWYKTNAYNVTGATNLNGYKVLWHD